MPSPSPTTTKVDNKHEDEGVHKVRSTATRANKVLFESSDPREVKKFVENNFPRPHHESEDHDVYVEHPDGTKHVFTSGEGEDGWSDYKTPREREDEK